MAVYTIPVLDNFGGNKKSSGVQNNIKFCQLLLETCYNEDI